MLVQHKEEIFEWIDDHMRKRDSSGDESEEEGGEVRGGGAGRGAGTWGKQIVNQNRGVRAVGPGEV